jgi:uncharacterized tellurite resistance protein B-like protein
MLGKLKGLVAGLSGGQAGTTPAQDRRQLELAVAGLLHEMMRADLREKAEEHAAMETALEAMFGIGTAEAREAIRQAAAHRYTSYFGPVGVIKRLLGLEERIALVEHLWRIAFADGNLDPYEDHFVRKIAHLLYVPNTEAMLARQRARNEVKGER